MTMTTLLSQKTFIDKGLATLSSSSSCLIHKTSQMSWATTLNSALALLLATTLCFLLHQVTRLPPTKVQYSEVDFLSITLPAQSALVNTSTWRCPRFWYRSPFPGVPFKYLKILYTASKCPWFGECMNWLTMLTAKAILRRVWEINKSPN